MSVALGRFDHGQGDAILDRAGGILILQLDEELAGAGVHARDLDQRRVADERKNGGGFFPRSSSTKRGHDFLNDRLETRPAIVERRGHMIF